MRDNLPQWTITEAYQGRARPGNELCAGMLDENCVELSLIVSEKYI